MPLHNERTACVLNKLLNNGSSWTSYLLAYHREEVLPGVGVPALKFENNCTVGWYIRFSLRSFSQLHTSSYPFLYQFQKSAIPLAEGALVLRAQCANCAHNYMTRPA